MSELPGTRPAGRRLTPSREERRSLALALLLGTVAAGSSVGLAATSGWLISRAALRPPILTLEVGIAAVQAFGLGRAAARYGERLAAHDAALRMLASLRVRVYRGLERAAPAGLTARDGGDVLSRLVADVDAVQDLFLRILIPVAVAAAVGGAAVAFVASVLPAAGLVLAAGVLAVGLAAPALGHAVARRSERRLAAERAALASEVAHLYEGMPELIACGAAEGQLARVSAAEEALLRSERRGARAAGAGGALAVLAGGATVTALAGLGLAAVRAGQLSGVLLAVLVLTPMALFEVLAPLPDAARAVPRVRAAARRVFEVADSPAVTREPREPVPVRWGERSVLAFHDASFGWPGGATVLRHVDLRVPAGTRVGLVGPSGAGKSTLAAALARFLDPRSGAVTIDGTDLRRIADADLRAIVGWCGQDAHLFDTTLRENLLIGDPGADDARLWSVLRAVRLADWAAALPAGLDTPVGVRGDAVSGGERQRLAVARALLADPPVLVVDEPTAHLDPATAEAVTADLLAAAGGRTVVWVTHRPDVAARLDAVYRVADGRVTPVRASASSDTAGALV